MSKEKIKADGAAAENKAPIYDKLEDANQAVKEQFDIIQDLTRDIQSLELENSELKAKVAGSTGSTNVIEHEGEMFKTSAGSYRDEDGTIIILDKNVLEAKQKIFGVENVRIASTEDVQKLVEEKSNLITIIEK